LRRCGVTGRGLVVVLPYLWLMLFFVVPFVIVLKISFSDVDLAIPPYKPLLEWVGKNSLAIKLNFNNYAFLFTDRLYISRRPATCCCCWSCCHSGRRCCCASTRGSAC
jgi:putrescine transport system permease protein